MDPHPVNLTDSDANPSGHPAPYRRSKEVRRSVHIIDKAADVSITVGGLAVILAVFGIMVFLAAVVVPLFRGGKIESRVEYSAAGRKGPFLSTIVDEYKTVGVTVAPEGGLDMFHVETGSRLDSPDLNFDQRKATAYDRTLKGGNTAFGFDDGSIQFGRIVMKAEILPAEERPAGLKPLNRRDSTDGKAIYSTIPGEQVRRITLQLEFAPPQQIAELGVPIVAMDYRVGGTVERPTRAFVTVDAQGIARLIFVESKTNMLTQETTSEVNTARLPDLPKGVKVADVLVTEPGDQVFVADRAGILYRYDTRDFDEPVLAERKQVIPSGNRLTGLAFLTGDQSVVVGGSDGSVNVYFRLRDREAKTSDGFVTVLAHRMEPHASAVRQIAISNRIKMFVTADANGRIWMRHATSEKTVLRLKSRDPARRYDALALASRDDGVLGIGENRMATFWNVSIPHPETTWKTLFGKVWYEGYPEPGYTWQSSSGTDTFEPKLSLVPLIFGTIKATLYSLLFAIPVALLGAVYTSEFVHPRVRATVKPTMEMMASLPSVVLGFIAALILAPIVESWIASVILLFIVLPASMVTAAFLWQLLPPPFARSLEGLPKFCLMFVALLVGIFVSYWLGPPFERLFFSGDLKAWAHGDVGTGTPFLFLITLPGVFIGTAMLASCITGHWVREKMASLSNFQAGLLDAGRWIVLSAVAAVVGYGLSVLLNFIGLDPRGGVVGTYVQRNVLVVGFAMGFAVIPIIYTIAEDALSAVPEHLRAASLACGGTPWQTAIYVILPTALSGVFAAIMIGMGRAVGETMIVVMAAGNTPLLDWNIFNGLRALSANIAVELPEAVKDGTLYRVLFLAALTLFVMTFLLNTLAEIIRIRFRKRAVQL